MQSNSPLQTSLPAINPTSCGLPVRIWLASRSPRRAELLETLGIKLDIFLAQNSPEAEALEEPMDGELPLPYVQRVTRLKLDAATETLAELGKTGIVLAADTTVALNDHILGKPQNRSEAQAMLESLSNQAHQVHTAVAVALLLPNQNPPLRALAVSTSQVQFSALPPDFIQAYIDSGEPFDKAGAYGIQGIAGQYVRHISGSHSGIMGLPLFETSELLRQMQTAAQAA